MSELNEFQKKAYEILLAFDAFCRENNIEYCLIGGSVLGGVRHKSFIPWDDDIDIGIPRDQYDKFVNLSKNIKLPFYAEFPEFSEEFYLDFGKIYNLNTTAIEDTPVKLERGVWIDIFPLDGVFANKILRHVHLFSIRVARHLIFLKRFGVNKENKSNIKLLVIYFLKFFSIFFSRKRITKIINFLLRLKSVRSAIYVGNILGVNGLKEIQPRENFFDYSRVYFVDRYYPAPSDCDMYLKAIYGDYMTPPPLNKRNSGHYFISIDLEKPCALLSKLSEK